MFSYILHIKVILFYFFLKNTKSVYVRNIIVYIYTYYGCNVHRIANLYNNCINKLYNKLFIAAFNILYQLSYTRLYKDL